MQIPVRIVLVETSHPGNIGASARAMKTMGLDELVLVSPCDFPNAEATARASGADDVLARARVVDSLGDAIADCGFVVGASARRRRLAWPVSDPRRAAAAVWEQASNAPVAMIFGPEHSGLTNEDLGRCNQVVHIPANPAYSSLNVAMAVQVLCYELRMAALESGAAGGAGTRRHDGREASIATTSEAATRRQCDREEPFAVPATATASATQRLHDQEAPPATAGELEGFHRHLESALSAVGYLKANRQRQLKLRLRRIFQRSGLDRNEVNILRGALAALAGRRKEG